MTGKQKTLFGISAILGIAAFSFASLGRNVISGNILKTPFAKANGEVQTVTFTRSNPSTYSGKTYTYRNSTPSGNDIYLISVEGSSRDSGAICTIPNQSSTYKNPVIKFYKDAEAIDGFMHQQISGVYVVTSRSVTMLIQTSPDGISFKDKGTLSTTTSGALFENFNEYDRYVAITVQTRHSSYTTNVTEVRLMYECGQSYVRPSMVSHYRKTLDNNDVMNFYFYTEVFNNKRWGRMYYNNYSLSKQVMVNYTWEYFPDKFAIKIIYVGTPPAGAPIEGKSTGSVSDYNYNCLFARFTTTVTVYNIISVFQEKIGFFFHSNTNTSFNDPDHYYEYSQRSYMSFADIAA